MTKLLQRSTNEGCEVSVDCKQKIAQASEATPLGKANFLHLIPFQSVCLAFGAHLFAFITKYNT